MIKSKIMNKIKCNSKIKLIINYAMNKVEMKIKLNSKKKQISVFKNQNLFILKMIYRQVLRN